MIRCAFIVVAFFCFIQSAYAGGSQLPVQNLNIGFHWAGITCLIIFFVSYLAVLLEEYTHMRKSKPVLLGAGLIWIIIGIVAPGFGAQHHDIREAIFHGLEEYASLLLFLLSAMTYIEALDDRGVFDALRVKLVNAGLSYRKLFWVTGLFAFFLSPVADNLTTALVAGAVILALGRGNPRFVSMGCINIVSAANAGGAFSPFGDITTLMVWQAEKVQFFEFFVLFIPALVNFLLPALCMSFFIDSEKPEIVSEQIKLKKGAKAIILLGLLTICLAVGLEQVLGLPPFVGMMIGLSLLMIAAWFISYVGKEKDYDFDIFEKVASAEWDTLLFFFGVIFSVGGLGYLGYLELLSGSVYLGWGPDLANIFVGLVSAIIDNIPVMYAVLSMDPHMDHFQWLLVTLSAGVGGTLLSIGSAAGVALMGAARGQYTFMSHLRWTPVLLLGYFASIATHYALNYAYIGLHKF